MQSIKLIKSYMEPIMEQNGFRLANSGGGALIYQNTTNPNLKILFSIRTGGGALCLELTRGEKGPLPFYKIILFLNDPDFPDTTILDGFWYYDNEEELIGVLEEQATLLKEKGFLWLNGFSDIDIEKMVIERAQKRAEISKSSTEEERKVRIQNMIEIEKQWGKRRVKL